MELVLSYLFTLLCAIALLSLFLLTNWRVGVWINPSSIFAGLWCVYLGLPVMLGFGVPLDPLGPLFILSAVCAFCASSLLFQWKDAVENNKKLAANREAHKSQIIRVVFGTSVIASLICHFADFLSQGITFGSDLINIGAEYSSRRYGGELNENVFSKLALLASIQCAVLGGLAIETTATRTRRYVVAVCSFFPSLLVMIIQSAKGLFFLSGALFIGGWMLYRISEHDFSSPRVSKRQCVVVALAILALLSLSFMSRGAGSLEDPMTLIKGLRYYFASYSSGHLFAFSDWLHDRYIEPSAFLAYDQKELTAGFYTFMSFFRLFGDDRFVPLGVYDEFFDIDGVLTTNIYTAFRGLIHDFGLVGALIFMAGAGFLANVVFYRLLNRKKTIIEGAFFVYFVGMAYQSYIISSLIWLSIPVSFLITSVVFLLARQRHDSLFTQSRTK